jgi:pathogenesis-related protein 1
MKNRLKLIVLLALFVGGCSSSDVTNFVNERLKKEVGVAHQNGDIVEGEENNIDVSPDIQEALDAHNSARSEVGVASNLAWDTTIANDAQSYADELAENGAWQHDSKNDGGYENGSYGENLYTSTARPSLKDAVDAWVDEKQFYTYGEIGDDATCVEGEMCGHYTQVVWKSTSRVGCAMSKYKRGQYKNWYLIVCKYQTPGNYTGETPY